MDDFDKVLTDKKFDLQRKMYIIISMLGICLLVCMVLFLSEGHIDKKKLLDFKDFEMLYTTDGRMIFCIDSVNIEEYLSICGWVIEKEHPISTYQCHIALENNQSGEIYVLPTSMVKRNDASIAYNNTSKYDNCGFNSMCVSKNIPLKDNSLEIIILYQNNGKKLYLHTGKYIENSEFY